jgi:hypothetical protein
MSTRRDRVVRQLQHQLAQSDGCGGSEIDPAVLSELQRRVRRLRNLGDEYSAVRVSKDVVSLRVSRPARCAGCA